MPGPNSPSCLIIWLYPILNLGFAQLVGHLGHSARHGSGCCPRLLLGAALLAGLLGLLDRLCLRREVLRELPREWDEVWRSGQVLPQGLWDFESLGEGGKRILATLAHVEMHWSSNGP